MVEITRVTKIENKNWELKNVKIDQCQRKNRSIRKNCGKCEILNGPIIPKFANFWDVG